MQQSISGRPPLVCPLNEINFLSWAVDDGYFPRVGPDERGWFKRQLVRTAITATRAIKQRWPKATIVWAEPLIHIAPHDRRRQTVRAAEQNLPGHVSRPMTGSSAGRARAWRRSVARRPRRVNFYPHNQWYLEGPTIPMGHHEYRPLADMLVEMAERYGKPIFLSETGAEGSAKPSWLHYVCNEVRDAIDRGADVRGHLLVPDHRLSGLGQSAPRRIRAAFDDHRGRHPPRRRTPARGIRGAAASSSPASPVSAAVAGASVR